MGGALLVTDVKTAYAFLPFSVAIALADTIVLFIKSPMPQPQS